MRYVDAFILPVPKERLKDYRAMARKAEKVWREHGALQYVEAVADDLDVKYGVPFKRTGKFKPDETVVISFIVFKSRADRDRVNAKVMSDPRIANMMKRAQPVPFDVKRMVYGGFKMLVDA
jgi:uncharacterized protein YbaA (DUF1428 family)